MKEKKSKQKEKKGVNSVKYFRCNFLPMINLESEIHDNIKPEHIHLLKRTPFGNLFMCFYEKKIMNKEVIKSTDDIISIMSTYSQDKDAFKIGKKWVKLTADDVALTFGLPKRGKKVHPLPRNAKESLESDFIRRHFREDKLLIKKAIVNAIKRTVVLNEKTDQEDFVRLVILYMSATIFFPNSLGSIGWSFIQHIEDFNKMNKISWPTVIHEYMMTQVRKHYKNPTHVSGCVILLLYWFCEHVDIISPFEASESKVPRFLRWSLHDLAKEMATQSLEELPDNKVSLELKDLSAGEKMLLDNEVEKKNKIENGEELDETVQEKNKRLTIENIKLQKRINYLEKKVQLLKSGQVDNNSLEEEEMEEDLMLTEEKEEEEEKTEKLALSPFLPTPEPISYQKPSFHSRTKITKIRMKDEGSDYEEENNQYKNTKRQKKEQNDVKQKEGEQEEIDVDSILSPSPDSAPVELRDLSASSAMKYLDDKQKAMVQTFFLNANKSTIAWEDKEKGIHITGSDLEDLIFGGFIDHKVVDWYALNLPNKLPNYATKSIFFSALAWNYVRDKRIEKEKHSLIDIIDNMDENVRFLFFPMSCWKTSKNTEDFHWTLLHFNRLSMEWSHYDSMLPRGIHKPTKYAQDANKMQNRVIQVLNEAKQYPVDAKLTIMECPHQGDSVDCALYVCHFMKKVACAEVLAERIGKERMERKRAKWTYKILSDPEKSWKLDQEKSV